MIIKNIDVPLTRKSFKHPVYFAPCNFLKNTDYNESPDSVIFTDYSDDRGNREPVCITDRKEYISELIHDLNPEEKSVVMELVNKGRLTEKDVKSLIEEHKHFKQRASLPLIPYYITDLSEEGKKSLMEYIKANNLSKADVKAMLKNADDWRDIEQMVCEYFAKEREEAKDFCLNMWVEREKSTQSRLKTIKAFYDEMNKTYAGIWAHKVKTNQDINEMIYKTFYG